MKLIIEFVGIILFAIIVAVLWLLIAAKNDDD